MSDLHMGSSDEDAIFHSGGELAALIEGLAGLPDRMDLVILGDALDYLTVAPYLDFTRTRAIEKTESILAHNVGVFSALAKFTAAPEKRIVWCIGNHDLELLFPDVRAQIEKAVFGAPGARPALDWRLHAGPIDYDMKVGKLRLVHGNKTDVWNAVDYDTLRATAEGGGDAAYAYPLGSRLVANVLNPLKTAGYKHVDLLKPEESVALPLTLALWPDQTRKLLKTALPLIGNASLDQLRAKLRAAPTFDRHEAAPPTEEELVARALRDIAGTDDPKDMDRLAQVVSGPVAAAPRAGAPTFAGGGISGFFSSLLQRSARRSNAEDDIFALDRPDPLAPAARATFAGDASVTLLIAGHTHLARSLPFPGGHYFNVGTWADLMRLPRALEASEFEQVADDLRTAFEHPEQAPYDLRPFRRLTYLDVELAPAGGRSYRATLRVQAPSPILASVP